MMTSTRSATARATLIGDLVRSRTATDRARLQRHFAAAVAQVSATIPSDDPPRILAGDECQGSWATVGQALAAATALRLALAAECEIRCGIGWGPVRWLDEPGGTQDGPGWWRARAAIEQVERSAARPATRWLRTAYQGPDPAPDTAEPPGLDGTDEVADPAFAGPWPPGPDQAAVNAALLCRDRLLGSWDQRSITILRGLMDGRTGREIAQHESISPSAVSQRIAADGIEAVLLADDLLRQL